MINLKWDDNLKSFEEFKKLNNLTPFVVINKHRKTYKFNDYDVMYDEVEKLGSFVEIEAMEESKDNIAKKVAEMRKMGEAYNMKLVQTGYVELYLAKFNNELYQQGKYKI